MNNNNSQNNSPFIYDLYDKQGTAKRQLNNILESLEETLKSEMYNIKNQDDVIENKIVISNMLFNITLDEIGASILWITYNTDREHDRAYKLIESIKNELEYSFIGILPYDKEGTPKMSCEYMRYEELFIDLYTAYLNDEDVTKLEYYEHILHFLVKKTFIRGF